MVKSQLIKDITINKISIEEGLQSLLLISSELNNEELMKWILGELNGYKDGDSLPEYRKNIGSQLQYSGINGSYRVKNQILQKSFLPKELQKIIEETSIRTSIRGIEKIIDNKDAVGLDLTFAAGYVFKTTGIQCLKISQVYDRISLDEIIANVKNKLIIILLSLEKEFGKLDGLDINVETITNKQFENMEQNINKIFLSDIEN